MKLEGKRILVVEDDELLRETFTDYLECEGGLVESVQNGEVAWERLTSTTYDILISDVRMPNGDGITLVRKVATLKPKPRVFICSGHCGLDAQNLHELGVTGVFAKPFEWGDLIESIARDG